jgi:hypothetical protein
MAQDALSRQTAVHGRRYLCGVIAHECEGTLTRMHISAGMKTHGSSVDAFKCMKHYLLRQGYTQVGPREFCAPPTPENPEGGPIRVLTKKTRYGAPLRPGKSRWMFRGVQASITSC